MKVIHLSINAIFTYNIDCLCTVMLVSGIMLQISEFMFLYGDAGVIWLWCGDNTDENNGDFK